MLDDLERPAQVNEYLLIHAHLLADEWDSAQQRVAQQNVLGWSSPKPYIKHAGKVFRLSPV